MLRNRPSSSSPNRLVHRRGEAILRNVSPSHFPPNLILILRRLPPRKGNEFLKGRPSVCVRPSVPLPAPTASVRDTDQLEQPSRTLRSVRCRTRPRAHGPSLPPSLRPSLCLFELIAVTVPSLSLPPPLLLLLGAPSSVFFLLLVLGTVSRVK